MSDLKLRIATRKSALALAQTTMAADAIVAANAAAEPLTYELVSMTTEGDRRLDKSLASFGGKGVFIKELEIALLEGRADIAIHSLKDMPAEVLPQFKLAAVLKREDPRDAFLLRGGAAGVRFMDLPAGARVGTGSVRRVVQHMCRFAETSRLALDSLQNLMALCLRRRALSVWALLIR